MAVVMRAEHVGNYPCNSIWPATVEIDAGSPHQQPETTLV
ncbi:hypothetical protein TMEN_2646 [Trichophyton mentagrophytes]|nr:hypothetical protein TMEN_2646 [Trichophyton mentagrophytes]